MDLAEDALREAARAIGSEAATIVTGDVTKPQDNERMIRTAVERQIAYGRECHVPWGMSESAFSAQAANSDYHYQSFGVPGLGLKRGLSKDLVISPYSTALAAEVGPGKTAAVVGDGAVGLCGVIAAKRLGAERIILLGRHSHRITLAKEFGATDIVTERGDEAAERVRELTDGFGAHSVLECVGHEQSTVTALSIARPGGAVGRVGLPQHESIPTTMATFFDNVTISGGPAPARAYIEELLPDVLEGRIEPGRVFDQVTNLDGVPDGYRAMNDREAIKVMVEL